LHRNIAGRLGCTEEVGDVCPGMGGKFWNILDGFILALKPTSTVFRLEMEIRLVLKSQKL